MRKKMMMMTTNKGMLRMTALVTCLLMVLTALLPLAMAAEDIDSRELGASVILEDPELIGDIEDEETSVTENPTQEPTICLDPALKAEDANVIRVTLPDAVHDELIYTLITLTKKEITGEKTVPGAVIEVRNSEGEVIYRATTDENGHIPDIPVTPGTYTFHERLAPEGSAAYALT